MSARDDSNKEELTIYYIDIVMQYVYTNVYSTETKMEKKKLENLLELNSTYLLNDQTVSDQ